MRQKNWKLKKLNPRLKEGVSTTMMMTMEMKKMTVMAKKMKMMRILMLKTIKAFISMRNLGRSFSVLTLERISGMMICVAGQIKYCRVKKCIMKRKRLNINRITVIPVRINMLSLMKRILLGLAMVQIKIKKRKIRSQCKKQMKQRK